MEVLIINERNDSVRVRTTSYGVVKLGIREEDTSVLVELNPEDAYDLELALKTAREKLEHRGATSSHNGEG